MLIVFSTFIITVSAEESDLTTKVKIGIKPDIGYYEFYNIATYFTWETGISYNLEHTDFETPFAVLDGYVIYKNKYLLCRGEYVLASDGIVNATGVYYTLGEAVYTATENTITFNTRINERTEFQYIVQALEQSMTNCPFTLVSFKGSYNFYYNSRLLYLEDYGTIKPTVSVGSGTVFLLRDECTHDYYTGGTVISPTCVSEGVQSYFCRLCGDTKEEITPPYSDGHNWINQTYIDPTCTQTGKFTEECEYCGLVIEEIIPFREHDYNFLMNCKNCGAANPIIQGVDDFFNTAGSNINNALNSAGEAISGAWDSAQGAVDDLITNAGQAAADAGKTVTAVSSGVTLIAIIGLINPYILKLIDWLNEKKKKSLDKNIKSKRRYYET